MVDEIIRHVLQSGAHRGTKYISPTEVIRVTRRAYHRAFASHRIELTVTQCTPNYRERQFVKLLAKAQEPFPVKQVQLQFKKGV